MKTNQLIMMIALIYCLLSCTLTKPTKYPVTDIRIFKSTPAWELAQAVESMDISEAAEIIRVNPALLASKEPEYGFTLLHWAIYAEKLEQTKLLLVHGADPNVRCEEGIDATTYAAYRENSSDYLRLTLQYGGNVNSYSLSETSVIEKTPLIAAISIYNLDNVKLLVDQGADVNLRWYYTDVHFDSPLSCAIRHNDEQIIATLLHSNKCLLTKPIRITPETREDVYVMEDLKLGLSWVKNHEDSLSLLRVIDLTQHKLDSLKRK